MNARIRIGLAAAVAIAVTTAFAGAAGASDYHHHFDSHSHQGRSHNGEHAVFVQTDNLSGNQVVSYDRADDGTLSAAATYSTGGLGGQLAGSVVDHLASQGSLASDGRSLYAVNAGSNSVSVFSVHGDQLDLQQVINSGGTFPVSVAVRGDLVYVLNALDGGSVQGFFSFFGHLIPVPGANQALGLDPTATPQFTHSPGQVAFSPDGRQLIVTTKANGNDVDVFRVGHDGSLSAPVVNAEPGTVPFAISFDQGGRLVIAEAGTNALASFSLGWDGSLTPVSSVATGQMATCWVASIGNVFYASNAGSGNVSGIQAGHHGTLTLLGAQATDAGTVDAAATPNGEFLYVQTGAGGVVDEFSVARNGSLTAIGSVTVPGAVGGEGIVAL
jgi:6-phosphogluconolactonase (cycloisomerase 2 family)